MISSEYEEVMARWPNWYHHVQLGDTTTQAYHLTLSPYGMALCAQKNILQGDEILFDYGYATNGSRAVPGWARGG